MVQVEPLVSVVSITYNHEQFISQMIEGVLMQRTNFPIELILAEDCSTDRTREIVLKYQKKYPDLIRIIMSEFTIGAVANEKRAMLAAKGKYLAICEGDDYWTDADKLQKQVDFLEANPDYCVCFHRVKHYVIDDKYWQEDTNGDVFKSPDLVGIDIDYSTFKEKKLTLMTLSMVFRKHSLGHDKMANYKYYRDTHQIYHLLSNGKGYLFSFIGGIRIIHKTGIYSGLTAFNKCKTALDVTEELYKVNKTIILRTEYIDVLQWCIYVYTSELNKCGAALLLSIKLFSIQKSLNRLTSNLFRIIKSI